MLFLSVHVVRSGFGRETVCLPVPELTADAEVHQRLFACLGLAVEGMPQLKRLGPPNYALDLVHYHARSLDNLVRDLRAAASLVGQDRALTDLVERLLAACLQAQAVGDDLVCTGD